jgi:hypothetical protein
LGGKWTASYSTRDVEDFAETLSMGFISILPARLIIMRFGLGTTIYTILEST